ncbi:hypothetical protein Pfra02_04380 [Pseudomonas fragi]|nr:hypothetical protein Pfra02_04380 [Pseudomonas fragi]
MTDPNIGQLAKTPTCAESQVDLRGRAAMTNELKSCPFCGSAAKLCVADYVDHDNKEIPIVECSQCSAWVKPDDWQSRAPAQMQTEAQPVEFDCPEYREQGMGCGLEDRGITDRYEAMRHGFDEALDQFAQIIESMGPLYTRADAVETEHLRTELKVTEQALNSLKGERDTLSAQLNEALNDSHELYADRALFEAQRDKARDLLKRSESSVSEIAATGRPGTIELLGKMRALLSEADKPGISAVLFDPCRWTDREALDFLGVALRHVDLVGTLHLNEIRQGFEYMRNKAAPACTAPAVDAVVTNTSWMTDAELDTIFQPGSGNKAKRRIEAINKARGES